MPGPPPPPPPGPPPPPLPCGLGAGPGPGDGRNQLLSSIRQGAKLKKTVTVDKSGPLIPGKVGAPSAGNGLRGASGPLQNGGGAGAAPPGLGGLFAGGMPKLRPTGKLSNATINGTKTEAPSIPRQPPPFRTSPDKSRAYPPASQPAGAGSVSQLSIALSEALGARSSEGAQRTSVRRQASEVRARGPPPQPPVHKQNMPLSSSDSVLTTSSLSERISSLKSAGQGAPPPPPPSEPRAAHAPLQRNRSALHGGGGGGGGGGGVALGGSMTSLVSAPATAPSPAAQSFSTSDLSSEHHPIGRVPSHGKPNLAPKPPTFGSTTETRPSPPPKKLLMNGKVAHRAQSMRAPRSPPVSPPSPQPGARPAPHLPAAHALSKMPASHFGTLRATRAPLRPPGVCPPPPPTGPPPAPPSRSGSLHAPPPPPPHRQHFHGSNGAIPDEAGAAGVAAPAPAPPVRGSSMRSAELEARFLDLFHPVAAFPFPDAFLRVQKGYSSTTVTASKQQAPPPPLSLPLDGWSGTSSAC